MLTITQALAIDANVSPALLAIPALYARPQGVASYRIRRIKVRVAIADGAQGNLGYQEAEQCACDDDQKLRPCALLVGQALMLYLVNYPVRPLSLCRAKINGGPQCPGLYRSFEAGCVSASSPRKGVSKRPA
jgi:hypothetical protein